ncbi:MAG TPA: amino acid ABC transporter substrate-binding protein [Thermoanaerobaculia bacterium]|nr:amino acid ABC transporter substrate-binding protein [Thermoanaerobaculia bacterium]
MRRTLLSAVWLLLGSMTALAADTIVFGAAISITGKTAKEGEYTRDGYQVAIDKINEMGGIKVGGKTYKVELKYYDDETKPERTAQLIEKLINEDKVNLILGPYGSSPTGTAAPLVERYKIPMVEANGSAESIFSKGYKYTFMILSPARLYLRGIIDAVRAKDPSIKTVAILGENESFSKEVAGGAAEYAKEKGMDIVYYELYPTNAQDVSALLTAIKGKNPDLILGSGHLQDSLLIAKQAKDLGVSPKAMGFSVGPSSPEFRANLGKSADYIFGATQWTEALRYNGEDAWKTPKAFGDAFRAKHPNYKIVPYQVAESAVAVIAYQKAIEKAGTIEPTRVRDALAALDMMTFYGKIKFDARGVNIYKPMAVEQYQPDGNKYTVWPQDVAEKPPLYPMPAWDKR